jgi:hypothetical protein
LFSLFFDGIPFITIEVIQEIAQPTVNPNIQILQGSAVILEETNWHYRIMEFVCCSNTRFGDLFSNIIRFCLKWNRIHQLIIRMPNWFWFKKTLPHTFLNTIFINETEYNNREIEAELYTHELTHVTQNTRWIFYSSNYWKPFLVQPIFFLQKSHQLNHEFLADESSDLITMFRSTNLIAQRQVERRN